MSDKEFKPYVPADSTMAELTFKAVFLGTVMAVVLGAANAYLGMKVGLTVAATFPAAVVAMAGLRPFRGTILEENVARTTASVGEALVAGAIFTIPAFVIAGVWDEIHLVESAVIMLVGGVLGVFFVIILRRTLVEEADLPFPESMAAAEIVKAGQGGQTGAKYVFGSMGIAALWEIFVNPRGIQLIADSKTWFFNFKQSTIEIVGEKLNFLGGMRVQTPGALPALFGVGFIVGLPVSSVLFAGALLGHLFLSPLALFLQPELASDVSGTDGWMALSGSVYNAQVKPLAVGAMIVAAFYTLWNLRHQLISGIGKGFAELGSGHTASSNRLEVDLNLKRVGIGIIVLAVGLFFLYQYFTKSVGGSIVLTIVMVILGFLFAAVAGYLVGLIGSSNNPISGLTLSTLIIAALLMLMLGVSGGAGIAGVLAVSGVICCACGIAGDMMQDLKVGHVLGGTPWKMEVGEIIGVIPAALVLPAVLLALDRTYTIGSEALSAPQAGLMALMSQGIVGGDMPWPLVIAGMFLAVGMILIRAPAPMLIAVGMYLPFYATAGIFVGGLYRAAMDKSLQKAKADDARKLKAENTGVLISSGLIAGGALTAVVIAFVVLGFNMAGTPMPDDPAYVEMTSALGIKADEVPTFFDRIRGAIGISPKWWLGLIAFVGGIWLLVRVPLKASTQS
ncbi:MAG: oligopeptide transporter, OPT family [Acidobacteriota bacterium]|nr:oligopeptide transporter, OPT family [Acidobacteriota bacterium]